MPKGAISPSRRERNPLITEAGFRRLEAIQQHQAAPRWNFEVGDRVEAEDLEAVEAFRDQVRTTPPSLIETPPPFLLDWLADRREKVPLFLERLLRGSDPEQDWHYLPTMSREDIASRVDRLLAEDADLSRLIVYDTSGTSGHALRIPTHPRTVALSHPLVELALARQGIALDFDDGGVACINVCAQRETYVFANVFSVWNQAGFAKVNLQPGGWSGAREAARRFFVEMDPLFLTGDPISFTEMMRWGIEVRPRALVSTAVSLNPGLRLELSRYFGCPVLDWYSSTETGPVLCSGSEEGGYLPLSPDLFVEVLDDDGFPTGEGEWGAVAVSGGRNPYLPLLRYLTGDRGRVERRGDARIVSEIEGRDGVFFRAQDGTLVNAVDVGRALRLRAAFVQHRLIQRPDGSCELAVRPIPDVPVDPEALAEVLAKLLGGARPVRVRIDERLGDDRPGGKAVPYLGSEPV